MYNTDHSTDCCLTIDQLDDIVARKEQESNKLNAAQELITQKKLFLVQEYQKKLKFKIAKFQKKDLEVLFQPSVATHRINSVNWIGPWKIYEVFLNGNVRLYDPKSNAPSSRLVNGSRLQKYTSKPQVQQLLMDEQVS